VFFCGPDSPKLIAMKKLLLFIAPVFFLASCCEVCSEDKSINKYFEQIRDSPTELNAFFSQMPKGGDLHNHFSGSVYAETYVNYVVARDYFIDTVTLTVDSVVPPFVIAEGRQKDCMHFSALNPGKPQQNRLPVFVQRLMQKWSVKDYNGVSYPSDKQFFETFSGFGIANNNNSRLEAGLLELKQRALFENVSYIETMFTSIPCGNIGSKYIDGTYNEPLHDAQRLQDESMVNSLLEQLYGVLQDSNVKECAMAFNDSFVVPMHHRLQIDDSAFTMRYQNYVARIATPASLFKNLVVCFESANACPLIVGVNIVAPEDNQISMDDYWLHMQMFKFCHAKYPNVKYSMHAGELTLGLVKPEELTWHINAAVYTAGANRIGHGVDMPYEAKCYDLLQYMAKNKTAIEINLYSNEFILKVRGADHPLKLYRKFDVPVVICTDDAGVLRSNLTHQYVLLASRYKDVSYDEIKKFVFNSIEYSFIEEQSVKDRLRTDLELRFRQFEQDVLASVK
jgi:adenosine deaminase